MNQIRPHLYLGDMNDGAEAVPYMAVLCVMWANEPNVPVGVKQIQTTDYDGMNPPFTLTDKMDEAADWIHDRIVEGQNVLVHCAYGVERSPLTVAWYLMRYEGLNLTEAYETVLSQHPQAQYQGTWLPEFVRVEGVLPPRGVQAHANN